MLISLLQSIRSNINGCCFDWKFYRKARRKEKDGDQNSNDTKLYLEESVLERKLTDANLNTIVELPAGLDYNEWLASHSEYLIDFVINVC